MDNDEKKFLVYLNYLDFLRTKSLKFVELRYQVALVIIPTIIGLWGFIGVTVTSTFFDKAPSLINYIIVFGVVLTISLLAYWRWHVYNMFYEEFMVDFLELDHENFVPSISTIQGEPIPILLTPAKQGMDDRLERIKKLTGGSEIIESLNRIFNSNPKIKNTFYKEFGFKLTNSGFAIADLLCIVAIFFLWVIGIFFPFWLLPILNPTYNIISSWPLYSESNAIIQICVPSFFMIAALLAIKNCYDKTRLYPDDIDRMKKYLEPYEN